MQNATRSACAIVALAAGSAFAGSPVDLWLTILHNNDGESQVLSAPGEPEFGGAARFATLVADLRATAAAFPAGGAANGSLLISAGDNILAGPEFNASLNLSAGELYYDAIALRLIGYDVLGVGNHEFDFNPDVFQRLIEDVNPAGTALGDTIPFVTANLDFTNEPGLAGLPASQLAPATVLDVQGRSVGVVGATTENLPFITSARNVIVNEVAPAVQAQVDDLRNNQGVEIIVVTSHLQSVDEELALAGVLRGVDVIIAGGGDDLIADAGTPLVPGDSIDRVGYPLTATDPDGRTVYVVSTPGDYKYIGRLVLGFDASGEVVAEDASSNLVRVASDTVDPVSGVAEDAAVLAAVTDPVRAAVDALATNVIGVTEVGLDGVRSNIRSRETNLGNLITDGYLFLANMSAADFGLTGPFVAIANGGGIRNDNIIPAGDLTELDTFDILPFGNSVSAVAPMSAAQFKEILENAVARIEAGTGAAVGSGTGRFAQVSGVRFSYDPGRQAIDFDADLNTTVPGERVREAVLADGTVLIENGELREGLPMITVITADFTASGGDEFPFRGLPFQRLGVDYQRSLQNFIEDAAGLNMLVTAAAYPEGGEGRIVNRDFAGPLLACNAADLAEPTGTLDIDDLLTFLAAFVAGSPVADLTDTGGSGALDIDDVQAFLNAFAGGCP